MKKLIIKHTYEIVGHFTIGEMWKNLTDSGGDIYCMSSIGGSYFIEDLNDCHLAEIATSWPWIQEQNKNRKLYIIGRTIDTESFLT